MLQTTTQHDIAGALKILIKEAGKAFEKRVHQFGAVYTDKAKRWARLLPTRLLTSFYLLEPSSLMP